MRSPKYKVIFRYKKITLWRNNLILRNKFLKQKWTDLNNYDLVIRSDLFGIDNAVKSICTYIGE